MVKDTRETLRHNAVKPVNLPRPLSVKESAAGAPASVRLGQWQAVAEIEDGWRVDDEWWRQRPTSRRYFAVRTLEGRRLVIFKDMFDGNWYRQSY